MPATVRLFALLGAVLLAASCSDGRRAAVPAEALSAGEYMVDDYYEVPLPRQDIAGVMQAKLAHAQVMLEGLALGNYREIEANAVALKRISQGAEWMAHDSTTYFALSATFREICDDMADHARAEDLDALTADYARLSSSCVECHKTLRLEAPFRNLPDRLTLRR